MPLFHRLDHVFPNLFLDRHNPVDQLPLLALALTLTLRRLARVRTLRYTALRFLPWRASLAKPRSVADGIPLTAVAGVGGVLCLQRLHHSSIVVQHPSADAARALGMPPGLEPTPVRGRAFRACRTRRRAGEQEEEEEDAEVKESRGRQLCAQGAHGGGRHLGKGERSESEGDLTNRLNTY